MGFVRNVTELLGPVGGAALIYTVASLFLMAVMGILKSNVIHLDMWLSAADCLLRMRSAWR